MALKNTIDKLKKIKKALKARIEDAARLSGAKKHYKNFQSALKLRKILGTIFDSPKPRKRAAKKPKRAKH